MAKKIQLQDANGNVLHPLTLGECVTMDNGENLDTLMSKSQMFTPTITQDKSMFKVGTGVDVDYSANVKDGAYESLVFKGKSLVNTVGTLGNFKKYSSVYFYCDTSGLVKPNTKYYYQIKNIPSNCRFCIGNSKSSQETFFSYLPLNSSKGVLTTKTTETDSNIRVWIYRIDNATDDIIGLLNNIQLVLIEYQEGMENWDIPYFTGLCDSKMPILHNVGENLFDPNNTLPDNLNYFYNSNNQNQLTTHAQMLSCAIPVTKGKTYSFYFNHDEVPLKVHKSGVFPTFKSGGLGGNGYGHSVRTITASMDGYFGIMFCYTEDGNTDNWTKVARDWKKQLKLTIVEAGNVNAHIPYKTNILRTSEEIVLREANGVQDTYNPLTGEYVRRIGEVTVDGSTGTWGLSKDSSGATSYVTISGIPNTLRAKGVTALLHGGATCNRLHIDNPYHVVTHHNCVGVYESNVRIKLENVETTVEAYKSWLQSNPITVQYELAEPITTIVKPSIMTPFAYQNGHVIVESGYEGQSLLPEIEYSVVAGRTGQVTQNTKVLRKQEQQIIGLEELLLTQIVQMEYERTLLQFDYELQMMMLG